MKWQKDKHEKKDKDSTPATGVNVTNTSGGKKKKSQDLSGIVCYDFKKNDYYTNIYPKSFKN